MIRRQKRAVKASANEDKAANIDDCPGVTEAAWRTGVDLTGCASIKFAIQWLDIPGHLFGNRCFSIFFELLSPKNARMIHFFQDY
ncbi:MAG: hypothetical protein GWP56_00365 [Gammaproteobacteria bacterium]|jgi:hypothetical protein|nr:hypothetical protein [Gammaproteobacteria bacterium]